MSEVLVLAETTADGVRKSALELLTLARSLGEASAVVCGSAGDDVVAKLGEYGATKVYVAEGSDYQDYLSLPKVDALVKAAEQASPAAILVISGPEGKDIAARTAVRLNSGIITDATGVTADGGALTVTQSVFSGQWIATSTVTKGTPVITVRPNAVSAEPAPAQAAVVNLDVAVSDAAKATKIDNRSPKASTGRPDLVGADVVVSGGRGVGSEEGFAVIEQMADALGGAVGATRAVTDLHWVSHDLQVGQTGKTVAPSLYVAAGLSGAIQHRAGMQSSKTIVAVNKDAKAPIFLISDFGVVGDLHKVLPELVAEIGKRKA